MAVKKQADIILVKHKITKAVIPVAGLGTRFYPVTKIVPKELLPIVDKPALQYVIEEALLSGLTEIILITNPSKPFISKESIYKLFEDTEWDLKHGAWNIETVAQEKPLGLGHAVLCAKDLVRDNWFVVLLPDVLIDASPTCTQQMINVWGDTKKSVIAVEHTPRERLSSYGVVASNQSPSPLVGEGRGEGFKLHKVSHLVEKPRIEDAPSDLTITGRYLLSPKIFKCLEKAKLGQNGEVQITDSLSDLAKDEGMFAYEYDGVLHDVGDKANYIKANVYYGAKRKITINT